MAKSEFKLGSQIKCSRCDTTLIYGGWTWKNRLESNNFFESDTKKQKYSKNERNIVWNYYN